MSLNKLTSDLEIKDWMAIGANTIKCNSLDTAELKIDGNVISPFLLKFSSNSAANPIIPIFPGPVIVVSPLSAGIGSTLFSSPFEADKQLTITTIGQINSTAASNVIGYGVLDNGFLVSLHTLSSTTWAAFDSVKFETKYVFISPTVARQFCCYEKNGGAMICYSSGNVTFQSTLTHPLDISFTATGACDFSHYQTTITYA